MHLAKAIVVAIAVFGCKPKELRVESRLFDFGHDSPRQSERRLPLTGDPSADAAPEVSLGDQGLQLKAQTEAECTEAGGRMYPYRDVLPVCVCGDQAQGTMIRLPPGDRCERGEIDYVASRARLRKLIASIPPEAITASDKRSAAEPGPFTSCDSPTFWEESIRSMRPVCYADSGAWVEFMYFVPVHVSGTFRTGLTAPEKAAHAKLPACPAEVVEAVHPNVPPSPFEGLCAVRTRERPFCFWISKLHWEEVSCLDGTPVTGFCGAAVSDSIVTTWVKCP